MKQIREEIQVPVRTGGCGCNTCGCGVSACGCGSNVQLTTQVRTRNVPEQYIETKQIKVPYEVRTRKHEEKVVTKNVPYTFMKPVNQT